MKIDKKRKKEYNSFEEYRKQFYPKSDTFQALQSENPRILGINMAKQSLNKFKHLLIQE